MQQNDGTVQRVVTGRVKANSTGGEIIHFTIPLGFLEIIVIVNIPDEGSNEAPVYLKYKFTEGEGIASSLAKAVSVTTRRKAVSTVTE